MFSRFVVAAGHRLAAPSLAAVALLLTGCATTHVAQSRIAKVNPASIAAAPQTWDGREVEIVGLLVWESGGFGLYQDYGAYCRGAEHASITVSWASWPGVTHEDSRRSVSVRGVFRNQIGQKQADGSVLPVNGALGPGPLEPGSVVSWLSKPEPPCPNRS